MKPQIKKLSACLALFVVSGYVVCPTYATYVKAEAPGVAPAFASSTSLSRDSMNGATVKRIGGQVLKAEPSGPNKADLSAFVPCNPSDRLPEGSVVQTGHASFGEIEWDKTKITTRIWADSMVRISPAARTVYMTTGALVFHKPRNCSDEYLVETKRLQARIRGTTVRVLSGEAEDKILVLECHRGPVEVLNKINNSKVNLTPGVELVVRGALTSSLPTATPVADVRLNPNKGELLFQDKNSRTIAYTANSKAVLEDPMIAGDERLQAFDSITDIREAMRKVPSSDNVVGNLIENAFNAGKPDKQIIKNVKIVCVPTKSSYYVGPNVGPDKSIQLPSLAYTDFTPAGVIPNMVAMSRSAGVDTTHARPVVTQVSAPLHMENGSLQSPDFNAHLQGNIAQYVQNVQFTHPMQNLPITPVQTTSAFQQPVIAPAVTPVISPVAPIHVAPVQAPLQFQRTDMPQQLPQLSAQFLNKQDAIIGNLGHN